MKFIIEPLILAIIVASIQIHCTRSQLAIVEDIKDSTRNLSLSRTKVVESLQEWLDVTVEDADEIVGVTAFLVAGKGEKDTTVASGPAILSSAWDVTSKQGIEKETKSITDKTTIMLASVSKLLTWTALSMIMDSGKFDLDDPINGALPFDVRNPRFPNEKITYRHIFAHTSGFKDEWNGYLYATECPKDPMAPYPGTLSETIKSKMSKKSNWYNQKPGSKYKYSNYACALGALLVEQYSGLPFPEFTKKFIFDPLQMTSTQWSRPSDGSAAELYTLYNKKGYKYKTNSGGYCFPDYPSGQLWSTPTDLAKFGRAMLKRGNLGYKTSNGADCLYSEVTGDFVFQKISPSTGDGDSALGWFVGKPYYKNGAGHDGGETGISSDFYVHLKSGVAVGFVANGDLSYSLSLKLINKLLESATALGSINNEFDPDNPKDCSTTWDADDAPTASPESGRPTPSPDNGTCTENSSKKFFYGSNKLQTCGWLSSRGNKATICRKKVTYKNNYGPPQVICPISCNSCGTCYENKFTKYSHDSKKNGKGIFKRCSWLKRRSKEKIKLFCARDNVYGGYPIPSEACPVTCNVAGC